MNKFFCCFYLAMVSWSASCFASRSIDIVNLETSAFLTDNTGESATLKCVFLNPSPKTQKFKLTYYYDSSPANLNPTNADVTLGSGTTIPATGEISLASNHSYTFFWCAAENKNNCQEDYIGGTSGTHTDPRITPIRLHVDVSNNDGFLVGNCVSHYTDNASKHRASSISVNGGKPF